LPDPLARDLLTTSIHDCGGGVYGFLCALYRTRDSSCQLSKNRFRADIAHACDLTRFACEDHPLRLPAPHRKLEHGSPVLQSPANAGLANNRA
jgi:hypothetical protein